MPPKKLPTTLRERTVMPCTIPTCRTVLKPTISLVVETIVIRNFLEDCPRQAFVKLTRASPKLKAFRSTNHTQGSVVALRTSLARGRNYRSALPSFTSYWLAD
jgi:hypothetical protein